MTDRRASLMVTCLGDLFFPEVGVSIVRLLRKLGVTVDVPTDQTCCGLPLFNSGYHAEAAAVARRTVSLFKDSEHVVVPSGSCAWMVMHEYPGLLADSALAREASQLAARTHEFSQFLVRVLGVTDFTAAVPGRVTYHDSCHLLRGLHESQSPRTLLGKLKGAELVPLPGADECCGFGGSFAVRFPGISGAMVQDKATFIDKAGVDAVVATDAGCLMNIAGCLRRRGSAVRVLHLAEVLEKT